MTVSVSTLVACTSAIVLPLPYNPSVQVTGAWQSARSFPFIGNSCGALFANTGVWYQISPRSGSPTVVTASSNLINQVQVFSGSCSALTCVVGDIGTPSDTSASVSFIPSASFYYVMVGTSTPTSGGTFSLEVSQVVPNVGCGEAVGPIYVDSTVRGISGSTVGAPVLVDDVCGAQGHAFWYYFISQKSGNIQISTCNEGTAFDTFLSLYNGDSCNSLTCNSKNDDYTCSFSDRYSQIVAPIVANKPYYVSVSPYDINTVGSFVLSYQMV